MTKWKLYKITEKSNRPGWINFKLDDCVQYSNDRGRHINVVACLPFTDWQVGEQIEIDDDATRLVSGGHDFTSREVRSYASVSTELVRFQEQNSSLQTQNYYLQQRASNLESEKSNLQSLIEAGRGQLAAKDSQISSYSYQLSAAQNQLTTVQNQLTVRNNAFETLTKEFNKLQIESSKKDDAIKNLREELEGSKNIEIRYKEKKLDELIRDLGLDQEKERMDNLRDAYEKLKRSSNPESYNRDNIVAAQVEIDRIKREFFQNNVGISVNDLHKIYKVCEKIAELRVKQEKLSEQQFEARQQQAPLPPHNN